MGKKKRFTTHQDGANAAPVRPGASLPARSSDGGHTRGTGGASESSNSNALLVGRKRSYSEIEFVFPQEHGSADAPRPYQFGQLKNFAAARGEETPSPEKSVEHGSQHNNATTQQKAETERSPASETSPRKLKFSGVSIEDAMRDKRGCRPRANSTDGELKLPRRGLCDESLVLERYRWKSEFVDAAARPKGLSNLGNTCFLNSTLQCLAYLPTFAQCLFAIPDDSPRARSNRKGKQKHNNGKQITMILRDLFRQVHHQSASNQQTTLAPRRMVEALSLLSSCGTTTRNGYKFRPGRQEDAHEFLVHLLDAMNDGELKEAGINASVSGWRDRLPLPRLDETTFVHRVFGGYLRSQVRCSNCKYNSNTYDPFLDLSLEVSKKSCRSLTDAIAEFSRKETLDSKNRWKCGGCKKHVCATKQMTVFRPPLSLCIQLKRFSFSGLGGNMSWRNSGGFGHGRFGAFGGGGGSGRKITKPIEFPADLDLPLSDGRSCAYRLTGAVIHLGSSATSGHYTAFVRKPGGKNKSDRWFHMDDSFVESVTERTVLQQKDAYILMYSRKEVVLEFPAPPLRLCPPSTSDDDVPEQPVRQPKEERNQQLKKSHEKSGGSGSSGDTAKARVNDDHGSEPFDDTTRGPVGQPLQKQVTERKQQSKVETERPSPSLGSAPGKSKKEKLSAFDATREQARQSTEPKDSHGKSRDSSRTTEAFDATTKHPGIPDRKQEVEESAAARSSTNVTVAAGQVEKPPPVASQSLNRRSSSSSSSSSSSGSSDDSDASPAPKDPPTPLQVLDAKPHATPSTDSKIASAPSSPTVGKRKIDKEPDRRTKVVLDRGPGREKIERIVGPRKAGLKAWSARVVHSGDGSHDLLGDAPTQAWGDVEDENNATPVQQQRSQLSHRLVNSENAAKRKMYLNSWDSKLDEGRKKKLKQKGASTPNTFGTPPASNPFQQRILSGLQSMNKDRRHSFPKRKKTGHHRSDYHRGSIKKSAKK